MSSCFNNNNICALIKFKLNSLRMSDVFQDGCQKCDNTGYYLKHFVDYMMGPSFPVFVKRNTNSQIDSSQIILRMAGLV